MSYHKFIFVHLMLPMIQLYINQMYKYHLIFVWCDTHVSTGIVTFMINYINAIGILLVKCHENYLYSATTLQVYCCETC